jgi:spermidine synthase
VEKITLVDLDPSMTTLFRRSPLLADLNGHAFDSSRIEVINADALVWLRSPPEKFGFIVVDFPDPTSYGLGKLYTSAFYKLVAGAMSEDGAAVVQSTSPMMARQSYWCIERTIASAGLRTMPYHTFVPSFGEWGFVLASKRELAPHRPFAAGLKFVDEEVLPSLFNFPRDMERVDAEVNHLNNQSLVRYYEREWARYGL